MKPRLIDELAQYKRLSSGWTYFLLSKDKKYLKIGRCTSDLSLRIKAINNDINYKGKEFRFVMAISDKHFERYFQSMFSRFRANYSWNDGLTQERNLTFPEVWRKARDKAKSVNGKYCKYQAEQCLWLYSSKTVIELFKVPRNKIANKLRDIVEGELDLQ